MISKKALAGHGMILLFITVLMAIMVSACELPGRSDSGDAAERISGDADGVLPESEQPPSGDMAPEDEFAVQGPIDGAMIEEMPIRAIAVTVDNYKLARPQTGLDKADLVYEIPVEGGITRYLAIFFHGQADVIGPIRSARPYLIDLAREWDAVYIHVGQSPQAQVYFKNGKIAHINQMYHSSGFWRDKARKAPHNLYSDTKDLWDEIVKLGWDKKAEITGYKFRAADESFSGEIATELTIPYQYGDVGYRYDETAGMYLRSLNDSPYKDLASDARLAAANVLVQQVSVRSFDAEGRLVIDLIGEGDALLFSEGHVQKGSWKKTSVTSRTVFYDVSGAEMRMKTGQTWIQLVPGWVQVRYR